MSAAGLPWGDVIRALIEVLMAIWRGRRERNSEAKEASRERVREVVDAVYSGDAARLHLLLCRRVPPHRPDA